MKSRRPAAALFHRLFPAALALLCRATLAANPEADALIQQGDAQVRALNPTAALAIFEAAAKADPNDAQVLLRLSQQYSNLIPQARSPATAQVYARQSLADAKKAEALAPDNSKAHLAVAVAYGRLTDFEDNRTKVEYSRYVKTEADKTLELDPKEDFAYHVLGRWNYAVATLNPVMKLIAKLVYGGMPEASLEEAVANYKKAIEIAPQRVIHHHELARAYVALGQLDDARKEWQLELTLKPEDTEGETDQKEARASLDKK